MISSHVSVIFVLWLIFVVTFIRAGEESVPAQAHSVSDIGDVKGKMTTLPPSTLPGFTSQLMSCVF